MRKPLAVLVTLLLFMVVALPDAGANTLPGRPFYVNQNLVTGVGTIYVFNAAGVLCGEATIAGVGPAGAGTTAWQAAMNSVITSGVAVPGAVPPPPGPVHFGVWFTTAGAPALCGGTISALNSYYIAIW